MFIPVNTGPVYVKKSDAKKYFAYQYKHVGVVLIGVAVVVALMRYFVLSKLVLFYTDLGLSIPIQTQLFISAAPMVLLGLVLSSLYLFQHEPNVTELNQQLSKYKQGELINVRELFSWRSEAILMLLIGIFVAAMIITVIMPIYNITAQIN